MSNMNSVVDGMTLNYVLDTSRAKFKDNPAIGMAMEKPLSYNEFHEKIIALAAKMHNDGVTKGDHIAILGENSHTWAIAYLATVRIGAITVPILPDLPEKDVHHILKQMQVKVLFTSRKQIEKVYEFQDELKGTVITLDDFTSEITIVPATTFSSYMTSALEALKDDPQRPEFPPVHEDDMASILYTSGTSGYSKAVMLSHKNLTANAYSASSLMKIEPGSVWLSILPMSHTYEFTCGFILPLLRGARIAYAGKTPTPAILQKLCAYEKPFAIFAVPLVLEKIYKKKVIPRIGKSTVLSLLTKAGVTRKLVYRKIGKRLLEFFGGNLQLMGIGGAALNPEVERFLFEAGFPYLIGYGMTESSPLIAGGPMGDKSITIGSVGKPVPGMEVKIFNPDPETGIGEITVCGANVMAGYYNDSDATEAVLSDEGWLSTGDLGFLDSAGNLHVSGRTKNVIVMANGENVYPEAIEHKINSYHWVVESLVIENNGQVEAWVYPDYEIIDNQTSGSSRDERRIYIENLLKSTQNDLNKELPKAARLAKIYERREPFNKTATHKIKRYLYGGGAVLS